MAYGSALVDNIQSSTANTPVVFKDGNGTQIGTLCRAWVNFNGTGTVAINASFNVSSITDNGTGDYTVNFTIAMSDANYSWAGSAYSAGLDNFNINLFTASTQTSSAVRFATSQANSASKGDATRVSVAVFR